MNVPSPPSSISIYQKPCNSLRAAKHLTSATKIGDACSRLCCSCGPNLTCWSTALLFATNWAVTSFGSTMVMFENLPVDCGRPSPRAPIWSICHKYVSSGWTRCLALARRAVGLHYTHKPEGLRSVGQVRRNTPFIPPSTSSHSFCSTPVACPHRPPTSEPYLTLPRARCAHAQALSLSQPPSSAKPPRCSRLLQRLPPRGRRFTVPPIAMWIHVVC